MKTCFHLSRPRYVGWGNFACGPWAVGGSATRRQPACWLWCLFGELPGARREHKADGYHYRWARSSKDLGQVVEAAVGCAEADGLTSPARCYNLG